MPAHAHTHHVAGCRAAHQSNPCTCESTRYLQIFGVTCLIILVQGSGWYFSGSLALLTDTGHVTFDGIAALISFFVARHVEFNGKLTQAEERKFRRKWMLVSASLLLVSLVFIAREAYERYQNPSEVIGSGMMIAAAIGALGNLWQHRLLPHQHNDTKAAQRLHVLGDLGSSIAVVVGGILIWITGEDLIDPIVTFGIVLFIAYRTIKMMVGRGHTH